jgi:hypothetical protein
MHVMQREILHCTWWSVGRRQSRENKKHKLALENKASSNSINNYLSTKNITEMEKQLSLAVQEATFAYHTAVHNHSFKSMDLHKHYRDETFQR